MLAEWMRGHECAKYPQNSPLLQSSLRSYSVFITALYNPYKPPSTCRFILSFFPYNLACAPLHHVKGCAYVHCVGASELLILHKVHDHAAVFRLSLPYLTLNLHICRCECRRRHIAVDPSPKNILWLSVWASGCSDEDRDGERRCALVQRRKRQ